MINLLDLAIGFVIGMLFLASIYPIFLDDYVCPNFLSIETCDMSTYNALVVDIIATSIFTAILAYFVYIKTKESTMRNMRNIVRIELGNFTENTQNLP